MLKAMKALRPVGINYLVEFFYRVQGRKGRMQVP